MLKTILGEDSEKFIEEIEKEEDLYDFFEEAKTNPKNLEKTVGKEKATKILEILNSQRKKKFVIKKEITLTSSNPNGVSEIKKILEGLHEVHASYISAGKYALKSENENPKKADQVLRENLKEIEKKAKKDGISFAIKEK